MLYEIVCRSKQQGDYYDSDDKGAELEVEAIMRVSHDIADQKLKAFILEEAEVLK